jgi:CheY-like chemotaxis protein
VLAENPALAPGDYVCVSVADTGSGMSDEVRARAFDPFFTTKPIGQGTGLGLSMIYGFAKQSNGHVAIDSETGRGTTVSIYLPRHVGGVPAHETSGGTVAAEKTPGGKILVVEDEAVVRGVLLELLQDEGYTILEASDGSSALRALAGHADIDLMITDVGLPGMNGRQLADQARESKADLKILFITGYAENVALAKGFLRPGMEMITKPFDLGKFAQKVREMIAP